MEGHSSNLFGAVYSSDLKSVMRAVTAGDNIQFDMATGIPILSMARKYEILTYLLSIGSDPSTRYGLQSQYPGLPAFADISSDRLKTRFIRPMLSVGADPNQSFQSRNTKGYLHPSKAALKSYSSTLDYILQNLANDHFPGEPQTYKKNITIICGVTNYDEVQSLKIKYPQYANMLNCQVSKVNIARRLGAVETALDNAAIRAYPQQTPDGVELPHVMKNIKDYVGYKNVGPGGRRITKNRKSSKKKTKKRK